PSILVVDDSAMVSSLLKDYFEKMGYNVLTASNGKEALEIAKSEVPELIISDINMPLMDGWGLIACVKDIPGLSEIPFVFLTVENQDLDIKMAMELGAAGYITKPFSFEELRATVETLLKREKLEIPKGREEPTFVGDLKQVTIDDLIQIYIDRDGVGTLFIYSDSADGYIVVGSRAVAGTRFGEKVREDALIDILLIKNARFKFSPELDQSEYKNCSLVIKRSAEDIRMERYYINLIAAYFNFEKRNLTIVPRLQTLPVSSLLDLATQSSQNLISIDEKFLPPRGVRLSSIEKVLNVVKNGETTVADCIVRVGQTPCFTLFALTELLARKIIKIS
ncbi:MAG: response regulator, partial [Deltaproteobacteria bacterium]|nr:response regulator [Deltaproteobacteria bacterium]